MYHTVFYIAKTFGYFWTVLYLIIATRAVAATPTYEGVWMVRKRRSQRYEFTKVLWVFTEESWEFTKALSVLIEESWVLIEVPWEMIKGSWVLIKEILCELSLSRNLSPTMVTKRRQETTVLIGSIKINNFKLVWNATVIWNR
jgi:hypothetical protein